ncbi:MAG: sugar phosphate nucleotidyltransferase [Luteitalea sp.]
MTAWPPAALVLTAGLGTRLRPLTDHRAKPAMPIGDDTLIALILRQLAERGITDAVLNLHHLPASITREVGDGTQLGIRVRYCWEHPTVLGSAGGPRHALPLVEGKTILIVNGDTLCDLPIDRLWQAHRESGALVTLGLIAHPQPGRYGGVTLDADAAVTGFSSRRDPTPSWHFPGVQLVEREVLAPLADGVPAETVLQIYPALMAERPGAVRGVVFDARFQDVGTLDDYRRTCLALAGDALGNVRSRGAVIADGAVVRESIVWPGAIVPAGCMLERVVVTGHVPLAPGTRLTDVVA